VVNLDALGDVGAQVKVELISLSRRKPGRFVLCALRGSDNAMREPAGCATISGGQRSGFCARAGRRRSTSSWRATYTRHRGRFTFGSARPRRKKDVLKKLLGRSPDHGDASTLVCWDNAAAARWAAKHEEERPGRPHQEPAAYGLDPYAGLDAWQRGG
jgi:hypothetical protein